MLLVLSACTSESDTVDMSSTATGEITASSNALPDDGTQAQAQNTTAIFDTDFSIKTLMNDMIQPNALELWQAVRYVVTEDGVVEDVAPQSDADWEVLRISAITLIEAGNALMLSGRAMDATPVAPDYPDYQYRPEEIQALLENDPATWRFYIQEMQFSTRATLEAIENQDLLGLIDIGARINNSCQGCHAEFWYKPNNQ